MRLAIISDIHANLEALNRALEIISKHSIDEIICLGDIIGYGANPNECLELVRTKTEFILLGNHDQAAIDIARAEDFNPYARASAEWTSQQLTDENKEFIQKLPYTLERHGVFFVHASPYMPHEWNYIITMADARDNFDHFSTPICFVGHSHTPEIFCEDIWTKEIVRDKKFIVNVGSVGQPRDSDPRLSFGIFDTEKWTYENVRSEYDVMAASQKIKKAGLPKMLADRLLIGR